jgi:hypothetical protein
MVADDLDIYCVSNSGGTVFYHPEELKIRR